MDVNWSAGGGASYVRVLRNGAAIVDNGPLTGHGNDCPAPAGTYTYRLEVLNPAGDVASDERTLTVTESEPQNPLAGTRWQGTGIGGQPVLAGTAVTAAFGGVLGASAEFDP